MPLLSCTALIGRSGKDDIISKCLRLKFKAALYSVQAGKNKIQDTRAGKNAIVLLNLYQVSDCIVSFLYLSV